jgi:hypothetical protein
MTAATKTESTFRMAYSVRVSIAAAPGRVWALLTDAARFPSWNTAVTSIEGEIALGQRLTVRVPLAPGRAFRPRVIAFAPPAASSSAASGSAASMVWSDGMAPMFKGTRTFTLEADGAGTAFTMVEEFKGVMLPMIKGSLPDFRAAFDEYAACLKRAAEAG